MAFLGVVGGSILSNTGAIGSLLGGSDPKKDEERKSRARTYLEQAKAGSGDAEARLRCMAGEMTDRAVAMGILDERGTCELAGGSAVGRAYAKQLVAELDAFRLLNTTKQAAGEGLIKVGGLAAGTGAQILGAGGTVQYAIASVPVWAWVVLAGVGGFLLVKLVARR